MKMNSSHISFEDGRCIQPVNKSRSVPVYWINLQKSIFRRNYYSYQLDNMGFENQRIKVHDPHFSKNFRHPRNSLSSLSRIVVRDDYQHELQLSGATTCV